MRSPNSSSRSARRARRSASAAQTLGRRTLEPDGLRDLLEGRFASALRTAAAQMTLEELHEQRQAYAERVKQSAREGLALNGLELESVAIVDLDQTQSRILRQFQRLRRRGPDPADRADRDAPADAQRDRAAHADRDPHAEPRRAAQGARYRARKRICAPRTGARRRAAPHGAAHRARARIAPCATGRPSRRRSPRARRSKSRASSRSAIWPKRASRTRKTCSSARSHAAARSTKRRSRRARAPRQEQIALELALEKARIEREREQQELELERRREARPRRDRAARSRSPPRTPNLTQAEGGASALEIVATQEIETTRARSRSARSTRRASERERCWTPCSIAKRQAFEEAEITSAEEIERARIATERGLAEARLARDGDLKRLEIERDKAVEIAELQSAIEVAHKTSRALRSRLPTRRARAQCSRGRGRSNQRARARNRRAAQGHRPDRRVGATMSARRCASRARPTRKRGRRDDFAEAQRIAARAEAEAEKIKAAAAAARYEVDAKGAPADQRGRQSPVRRCAPVAPARKAAREDRGHRARKRPSDGEDRGHQDPAYRRHLAALGRRRSQRHGRSDRLRLCATASRRR